MTLRVLRLDPGAALPSQAHPGDAGLDLCSLEPVTLAPGARAMVRTGIAIELPAGHAGWIVPRSGLAARHGLSIVNAPGLIDAGYRGEINVLLLNTDAGEALEIAAGDRVAQLVVTAVASPRVVEVQALSDSVRAAGGFGSTGVGCR